jgi:hypothetical protein
VLSKIDPTTLPYETRMGDLVKWARVMKLRLEIRVVRTRVHNGHGVRRRKKAKA